LAGLFHFKPERHNSVTEQTLREPNEGHLTGFGIRAFKPTLRKAEEKLKGLRTAEGSPSPQMRNCAPPRTTPLVCEQIRAVEQERLPKLAA